MNSRRPPGAYAALLLVTTLSGFSPHANGQAFRTENGHVAFTSRIPLHTFDGTSEHLVGRIDLADSTVDFYVDLETLKTGIGKRDRDMRLTLETKEYPFAEFFGKLVSPFDIAADTAQPVKVIGDFKMHGVTQHIEVSGTLTSTIDGLTVEASWPLDLDDFQIEPPNLLMMTVDKIQQIRIKADLKVETQQKS